MANYAAPPSRRVAYDRDDTQLVWWQTDESGVNELDAADKATINGEDDGGLSVINGAIMSSQDDYIYVAFVFSQAFKMLDMELFISEVTGTPTINVERSDDTTNGRDGTWTQEAASIAFDEKFGGVRPLYRVSIASVGGAAAHIGWRIKIIPGSSTYSSCSVRALHIYGPEFGPTDRLAFWHPTLDQEITPDIDFEDLARATTSTKQFRVKNLSGTLTASTIELTSQLGVSFDGGQAAYTLLSEDDISYYQTVDIGNLAPGAISPITYLKASPGVSAVLSTLSVRVTPAVTGGWA